MKKDKRMYKMSTFNTLKEIWNKLKTSWTQFFLTTRISTYFNWILGKRKKYLSTFSNKVNIFNTSIWIPLQGRAKQNQASDMTYQAKSY